MKRTLINMAVLGSILGASMAHAGGWDRSGQDTSIIMKEGSLLEVTSVTVAPKVTGTYAGTNAATGDVTPDYSYNNIGFRTDINDDFSFALIQDEPFGAGVDWSTSSGQLYSTISAKIKSDATTVLIGYDMENVTLFGGLKNQSFGAEAARPLDADNYYTVTSTPDNSLGYVIGAGFEKPEIGLKVGITYHTKIDHQVSVVERIVALTGSGVAGYETSTLNASTPSSFNLNFQTGIAENTLLFGSIRSAKWTETDVKPNLFEDRMSSSLKKFENDVVTYNLGVARRFTDQWVGAFTYGTEAAEGGTAGPLGPTDGFSKMGLAVTYSAEQADITLAMQKVNNGDTQMDYATMTNNTTTVTAVKVAYKF